MRAALRTVGGLIAHHLRRVPVKGDTLELGPFVGAATEHTRIKVGVGVCGTAVARNADMNVPDVSASDNYLACSLETRSELVVPLIQNGAVIGVLDLDSPIPARFDRVSMALHWTTVLLVVATHASMMASICSRQTKLNAGTA